MQLGRYPAAHTTIAHLSDMHLLAGGAPLGGAADTVAALDRAVDQLDRLGTVLDAIVVTGDIADLGEPDAYRLARAALDPLAERAGAELVWVMGNHDEREPFAAELLDLPPSLEPLHRVVELGGVRLVSFDVSVPGWHHGAVDEARADWLSAVLAEPAPMGTVLAVHHAPIPTPIALMDVLELQGQARLAEVLRGSDVRLILGGHLHYPSAGSFAGIPVSIAGATAYTLDVSAPPRELQGVDGGRSFSLVQLFDDGHLVSVAPLGPNTVISRFDERFLDELSALDPPARLERFSRKRTE
ncbi:metallophosphoesterase [Agromyces mediolanus]|uniref:3',5'-cyclic adenosine monophosphate phosphodiesterase CpdA n=1 Tax=Agromyces mediolanus TaxID=41986 RepID=A0A918CHX6_AGRME|nr:metallophosphoesterase [Agromyces mediolanus]GGR23827.1 3',5'-cyclic adenosine monophosphate phosphodiesterase CpdA [Agromyces mediolanus]GLJ71037.1 3',5'-cyclic adenosine monophosphate phosphodiesterase CpdA [Agromyces mediolanus]